MSVISDINDKVILKIRCIPFEMKEWLMLHLNHCEMLAAKHFRDEIQKAVLEAYKKYW